MNKYQQFTLASIFAMLFAIGTSTTADELNEKNYDINDSKMHLCVSASPTDQFMIDNPEIKNLCIEKGFFE